MTEQKTGSVGYARWIVCALLFGAATINYLDRQIIAILKGTLQAEFSWTERDYAAIIFSFSLAYAIGLVIAGLVMDGLGTKKGFALAVGLWSFAAVAHGIAGAFPWLRVPTLIIDPPSFVLLTGAAAGFALARFALGLGEAGNFPASIKTVAEWFPKRERAFATGIFNSGTNLGALAAPILVPIITLRYGWEIAFMATGMLGFFWVILWLKFYSPPETHPTVSKAELALIRSDPPEPMTPIPWKRLFPHRQTWAFAIGKFLTDPIWWLYLYWIPDFLKRNHGIDLTTIGPPVVVIYLVADVGSIGGGWLSSMLIKRGWTVNRARKMAMLICALCVTPIVFASQVKSLWLSVALVSLAAAAHQGWSANLFTFASDMFPRRAVGSVVGIGGTAGAIGGMLIALVVGEILQRTGSYFIIFIIAGSAYLVALAIIHAMIPNSEPAPLDA
ncbi:MAG: MFS transporter [Vicinamibacteria bacterium]